MKGGGAAGVEVAQQLLAETKAAILPPVPYFDTLRWVLIAGALGGIAAELLADGCGGEALRPGVCS